MASPLFRLWRPYFVEEIFLATLNKPWILASVKTPSMMLGLEGEEAKMPKGQYKEQSSVIGS